MLLRHRSPVALPRRKPLTEVKSSDFNSTDDILYLLARYDASSPNFCKRISTPCVWQETSSIILDAALWRDASRTCWQSIKAMLHRCGMLSYVLNTNMSIKNGLGARSVPESPQLSLFGSNSPHVHLLQDEFVINQSLLWPWMHSLGRIRDAECP